MFHSMAARAVVLAGPGGAALRVVEVQRSSTWEMVVTARVGIRFQISRARTQPMKRCIGSSISPQDGQVAESMML